MTDIDKQFFGKPANSKVNLSVEQGEIHALLGENGAGKTTLMNILYGLYQSDGGSIELSGEPVTIRSPKDAIGYRIGMVHQHFHLVPTLSVSENITLGLRNPGHPFVKRRQLNREIRALSERYNLAVDPCALVKNLSVGQQQRVEIIKVLYRRANLLILDEPTAVLTPGEVESLFEVLRTLRAEGHSVIIITHHIGEVLSLTDRITVLRNGYNAGEVETARTTEEELSSLMIGRPLQQELPERPPVTDTERALVLDGITSEDGRLGPLSLTVPSGSIVAVAGVDGNGQKELAEMILGMARPASGTITLDSRELNRLSVRQRKDLGIGYISDDRLLDSLVLDMDLRENLLLSLYRNRKFRHHILLDRKALETEAQKAVSEYGIKTASLDTAVRYLSGGNQQKLILARELEGNPRLVIASQCTRGLDIGSSEEVHAVLRNLRDQGCSVLLISSDLEEILKLGDRIAVMHKGRIVDVLENRDIDLTYMGLLMAGSGTERRQA